VLQSSGSAAAAELDLAGQSLPLGADRAPAAGPDRCLSVPLGSGWQAVFIPDPERRSSLKFPPQPGKVSAGSVGALAAFGRGRFWVLSCAPARPRDTPHPAKHRNRFGIRLAAPSTGTADRECGTLRLWAVPRVMQQVCGRTWSHTVAFWTYSYVSLKVQCKGRMENII